MGNTAKINDVNLWWEDFGEQSDPVVLLITGAYVNSQAWPDQLIQYFINNGMRVICFDNRDSGKSTWFGKKVGLKKQQVFCQPRYCARFSKESWPKPTRDPTLFPLTRITTIFRIWRKMPWACCIIWQ